MFAHVLLVMILTSNGNHYSFIGEDYYCESGTSKSDPIPGTLFLDDPLWDGTDCRLVEEPCCNASSIPWFNIIFPTVHY